ncbi:MAG: hypothetical protein CVU55_00330 [Deltaproteobacteria bacterium HGW-Deltaproteobacteria-13]|jgi:hypothetical protein|nr:MAG: hypothetical protein CVU55_00330 [Deltaproteobacteria bacterium HGW-Deltaproteobacteria-13]
MKMNASERIAAVVSLACPDRVPLAPLLDHWAAPYAGITNTVLMNDSEKRFNAVLKTARDFRWDMTFLADTANTTLLKLGVPARIKLPGRDLPEHSTHQFDEIGFMTDEDYDVLEKDGIVALFSTLIPRIYPEMTIEQALMDFDCAGKEIIEQAIKLREKGIEPAVGFVTPGPSFEYFCFARTVNKGLMDLRKRPAKIKSAGRRFCEGILELAVSSVMQNGIQRVFIGMSRSSPVFLTSKYFEEFIVPDLDFLVHGLIDANITPVFHCDTNWTKFLPYFLRFPKARCILELDSFTDIFKAKEILGDHMAIMGDVPSTLLAEGSRDEVLDYCKRLIETIGKGGGFILSSGCSIPLNAKADNVMAMTEAVEEWGWY